LCILYKDKPKKAILKTKQVKTSTTDKEEETPPALCSISEEEDYKTIKKEIGNEVLTDILVGHILTMDIKVFKISLESNVTVFQEELGHIKSLPKNLNKDIKVGRYSADEDQVITLNWYKLIEELKLKDHEEIVIKEVFETSIKEKDLGLKRNVLGYFLSQGLSKVRLATEVFQRARTILWANKGEFTTEEDQKILEGRKEGNSWAALTKQLRRTSRKTVQDRYDMLICDSNYKHGRFTVMEDELILREVFAVNKNNLVDRKITVENWKNIGEKLQRHKNVVRARWTIKLEPLLKRYHAGTLNKDVREVLINHLFKNKLNYAQEVNWKALAKLAKFAGTTPTYLNKMYRTLRNSASNKYPELSEVKLDTGAIQMYLDNREKVHTTNKTILEHQDLMIAFYLRNILKE
jgi:hypothetical protein